MKGGWTVKLNERFFLDGHDVSLTIPRAEAASLTIHFLALVLALSCRLFHEPPRSNDRDSFLDGLHALNLSQKIHRRLQKHSSGDSINVGGARRQQRREL